MVGVRDGMRTPGDIEALIEAGRKEPPSPRPPQVPEPKPPTAGEPSYPTKFRSPAQRTILTLNIRRENSDGSFKDSRFDIQFFEGFVDITKRRYPFKTQMVSEAIQALPGYGLGRDFWNFDDEQEQSRVAEKESLITRARELAATDPEVRAALRQTLEEDFKTDSAAPAV